MGWILAAAATASAFNLVCVGTQTVAMGPNAKGDETKEVYRVYRVDLSEKRYCISDCTTTRPIARVEPMALYLESDLAELPISNYISINREDGRIISSFKLADMRIGYFGWCEVSAFTGFPQRKF